MITAVAHPVFKNIWKTPPQHFPKNGYLIVVENKK
jgi:hypothetical protein